MILCMSTTHLLYLHGFRSSPQSAKSRIMAERVARTYPHVTWWCPQLPASPREAAELIGQGVAMWPRDRMAVIGSSLGGYYATWLAENRGSKAVLLNPAVNAARDLTKYVGEHSHWHNPSEKFVFKVEYVEELKALQRQGLTHPSHYFAVIAKGDEVLDWREMTARYAGAKIKLLEGSDHALSDFDDHLEEIISFLKISPTPTPHED